MRIFLVSFICIFIFSAGILTIVYSERLVPDWVKDTAKWYGTDMVSEQEYLDSIKFLIEHNIITINQIEEKHVDEDPIMLTLEESFIDPRVTQCKILYSAYNIQGESRFEEEYSYITYIQDCIDLYQDKVWHYQGEDKLERIYNEFIEIHKQNVKFPPKAAIESDVNVRSITNIGNEKFLVKFDICAGDSYLDKAKVLVKSDIETILVGSDKDIAENSCRNYETLIYSKYPKDIEVEIVESIFRDYN